MSLEGRVALVTGGASGIGASTAQAFAQSGARVAVSDLRIADAARISSDIGPPAEPFELDVTRFAEAEKSVDSIARRLGPIDILVNCAGVLLNKPFLDLEVADFDRVIAANLTGTCFVGQAVARTMLGRGGRIINIASVAGLLGYPGRAAYAASKGGVIAMTRVMALELAPHDILVNAIAPGPVDTPMTQQTYDESFRARAAERVPVGRFASAHEIAQVALFLASPAASFITGQVITADGGMSSVGMTLQRQT